MRSRFALAAAALAAGLIPVLAAAQTPAAPSAPAGTMPPTCSLQSSEKKLAGAAQKSFMTKCQKDATSACTAQATEKKLRGAAKTSFTKKCVTDSVGT